MLLVALRPRRLRCFCTAAAAAGRNTRGHTRGRAKGNRNQGGGCPSPKQLLQQSIGPLPGTWAAREWPVRPLPTLEGGSISDGWMPSTTGRTPNFVCCAACEWSLLGRQINAFWCPRNPQRYIFQNGYVFLSFGSGSPGSQNDWSISTQT
jgi:hypothetical protein